jgi:hypothetical protein
MMLMCCCVMSVCVTAAAGLRWACLVRCAATASWMRACAHWRRGSSGSQPRPWQQGHRWAWCTIDMLGRLCASLLLRCYCALFRCAPVHMPASVVIPSTTAQLHCCALVPLLCYVPPPPPQLDASQATAQAQAVAFRRVVGRGGLNEQAAENTAAAGTSGAAAAGRLGGIVGPSSGAGARRADAAVSEAQVVRHPSEAERVLRLLQQQISKLGMTRWALPNSPAATPCAGTANFFRPPSVYTGMLVNDG